MPLKAPCVELLHHLSQHLCQGAPLQHHRTYYKVAKSGGYKKVGNEGKSLPLTANLQIQCPLRLFPRRDRKTPGGARGWAGTTGAAPSALPTRCRPRRCGNRGFARTGHGRHGGSGGKAGTPRRPGNAASAPRSHPGTDRASRPRPHAGPSDRRQKRTPLRDSPPRPGLLSSRYHDRAAPPRLPRRLPRNARAPRPAARVRPGPAEPRAEPGHGPAGRAAGAAGSRRS